MRIGGASVMGSYHDKNQDSFIAEKVANGWLIAVSDGVGSCRYSEAGSSLACKAVKKVIEHFGGIHEDLDFFFETLHKEWIGSILCHPQGYDSSDCYATLLFSYYDGHKLFSARLGDGIIGISADDQYFLLYDDKNDHMCNETDCLYEKYAPEAWDILEIESDRINCVIIGTDGLSIEPHKEESYKDFIIDIYSEYSDTEEKDIIEDMYRWLPQWESSDDKSMVFLMGDKTDGTLVCV